MTGPRSPGTTRTAPTGRNPWGGSSGRAWPLRDVRQRPRVGGGLLAGELRRAPSDGSAGQKDDCTNRVICGGSWFAKPSYMRTANNNLGPPPRQNRLRVAAHHRAAATGHPGRNVLDRPLTRRDAGPCSGEVRPSGCAGCSHPGLVRRPVRRPHVLYERRRIRHPLLLKWLRVVGAVEDRIVADLVDQMTPDPDTRQSEPGWPLQYRPPCSNLHCARTE